MINKRWFKFLKNKKGFTLLECVASIAIIGIMGASLYGLFNQGVTYINQSKFLYGQAGLGSQVINTSSNITLDSGDSTEVYYLENIPVTITVTIIYPDGNASGDSQQGAHELSSFQYMFNAGVVINEKNQTKVVYYDISPEELKGLRSSSNDS